ncbi:bromodomain and WD repeat domain containing protein [Carpediemonas membranifera]|uniref:Bromodomain and WD repeat domain containing protein n=1 Tax=Carpediemonas membranifera TaxID=201153 RepID=A0A8J6E494_9EUKA|nr:bromodomain and WD repeat domain containing protein [Carpediemonas membranifera]|eukprot:KAG9396626.1 bromodomain and WD repeat domain containing protein [Carpediemonas membranifera]
MEMNMQSSCFAIPCGPMSKDNYGSISYSPNFDLIAYGVRESVVIVDPMGGTVITCLSAHRGHVRRTAWVPISGKQTPHAPVPDELALLTLDTNGNIILWDIKHGVILSSFVERREVVSLTVVLDVVDSHGRLYMAAYACQQRDSHGAFKHFIMLYDFRKTQTINTLDIPATPTALTTLPGETPLFVGTAEGAVWATNPRPDSKPKTVAGPGERLVGGRAWRVIPFTAACDDPRVLAVFCSSRSVITVHAGCIAEWDAETNALGAQLISPTQGDFVAVHAVSTPTETVVVFAVGPVLHLARRPAGSVMFTVVDAAQRVPLTRPNSVPIVCTVLSRRTSELVTASSDGRVTAWSLNTAGDLSLFAAASTEIIPAPPSSIILCGDTGGIAYVVGKELLLVTVMKRASRVAKHHMLPCTVTAARWVGTSVVVLSCETVKKQTNQLDCRLLEIDPFTGKYSEIWSDIVSDTPHIRSSPGGHLLLYYTRTLLVWLNGKLSSAPVTATSPRPIVDVSWGMATSRGMDFVLSTVGETHRFHTPHPPVFLLMYANSCLQMASVTGGVGVSFGGIHPPIIDSGATGLVWLGTLAVFANDAGSIFAADLNLLTLAQICRGGGAVLSIQAFPAQGPNRLRGHRIAVVRKGGDATLLALQAQTETIGSPGRSRSSSFSSVSSHLTSLSRRAVSSPYAPKLPTPERPITFTVTSIPDVVKRTGFAVRWISWHDGLPVTLMSNGTVKLFDLHLELSNGPISPYPVSSVLQSHATIATPAFLALPDRSKCLILLSSRLMLIPQETEDAVTVTGVVLANPVPLVHTTLSPRQYKDERSSLARLSGSLAAMQVPEQTDIISVEAVTLASMLGADLTALSPDGQLWTTTIDAARWEEAETLAGCLHTLGQLSGWLGHPVVEHLITSFDPSSLGSACWLGLAKDLYQQGYTIAAGIVLRLASSFGVDVKNTDLWPSVMVDFGVVLHRLQFPVAARVSWEIAGPAGRGLLISSMHVV